MALIVILAAIVAAGLIGASVIANGTFSKLAAANTLGTYTILQVFVIAVIGITLGGSIEASCWAAANVIIAAGLYGGHFYEASQRTT